MQDKNNHQHLQVSEKLIQLVEHLTIEHTIIIRWTKEIVTDLEQKRPQEYLSEKINCFWEFALQHILKEDADFYPNLPQFIDVDKELESFNDVYCELEDYFKLPYEEVTDNFPALVAKIKSRIRYEERLFADLMGVHTAANGAASSSRAVVEKRYETVSEMGNFTTSKIGDDIVIQIKIPTFDFMCRHEFQSTYKQFPVKTRYAIDFKMVKFIDSSSLGMIVEFMRYNGDKPRIKLINCNNEIKHMIRWIGMDALFDII